MLTLWNNFRLWARKCRICGGNFAALLIKLLFGLQMGNWKNNFEGNFTFSDLFRTSRELFWFFRCIILGMVIQTEFHQPRGTYQLGKILWEKFLSFPDYERNFLNIQWSRLGIVVKTSLLVHRSTLRKVIFFEFFKIFFGLWAIIVQTSGEKFQQRFQMCILRVRRTFLFFFVNDSHVFF